jgi:hypothetical protein
MSKAMDKVEVIVERISPTSRDERFIEWIDGWLRARYVVDAYLRHNMTEVVFVLRKDMFHLFKEMYRVVEMMRETLHVGVPVAICSDDECIDLSENREETFVMLMSKYKIRRLERIRNMVKRVLTDVDLPNVYVVSNGGRIWIGTNCSRVMLYVDEAIVISEILLSNIHSYTKLKILGEAADRIFKMFGRDIDLSIIDIKNTYDGFIITIGGCKLYLDYDEALRLIYEMLTWSIIGLKRSLIAIDEK